MSAPAECTVCGAYGLIVRPGNGHAEWCERTTAWLRNKHPVIGWTRARMRRCGCAECVAAAGSQALAASPRGEHGTAGGARDVATAGASAVHEGRTG